MHDAAQRDAATEQRVAEMEKEQHRQLLTKMEALEAAVISLRARERDLVEGERGQSGFTLFCIGSAEIPPTLWQLLRMTRLVHFLPVHRTRGKGIQRQGGNAKDVGGAAGQKCPTAGAAPEK